MIATPFDEPPPIPIDVTTSSAWANFALVTASSANLAVVIDPSAIPAELTFTHESTPDPFVCNT